MANKKNISVLKMIGTVLAGIPFKYIKQRIPSVEPLYQNPFGNFVGNKSTININKHIIIKDIQSLFD
ncbi:hypothetical protein [Paenibacillus alginolyticus]|uniref:hypothetical protein n=1 Tax=Paenibacillus alginolyticus TaxID=59839 RepID=UPI002DB91865|nr:hypothetical protein [Paenibacillus alginolyticus]MEC0148364.1 hypothetical protein [Paenibacillus alginolyticus]